MRIFFSLFFLIAFAFGSDGSIEVVKKVDILPTMAVEDGSVSYDDSLRKSFFKSLVSDINVLSFFNVDPHMYTTNYDDSNVVLENKDKEYVVRYKIFEDSDNTFNVSMKILHKSALVKTKSYKIKNKNLYVFVAHAMAYDLNEYMGGEPVEWMKRKVLISRLVSSGQSEIVICDYTLIFSQRIVKGGINLFPKWANREQTKFYYTSLSGRKPLLKEVEIANGKSSDILSSDGMMICSDVSSDGKKLLVTMAPEGQPDIYLYDVTTKKSTRLTTFQGIDVNAQFMSNNRVAFISNRLGYPNLFSLTIGSNAVQQLVFTGKSNSSCSAFNDNVVYKARESSDVFRANTFNLHLISTQNGSVRRLTATGVNEFPRFSREGDAILYVQESSQQSSIGVIRLKFGKNFLFPLIYGKIQSIDW